MITESFINSCFSIILNRKVKIKRNRQLYRDILETLEFPTNKEVYEIPVDIKNKLDFLKKVTNMLIKEKTIDSIIDSISFSEKFKQHQSFLLFKLDEELSEKEIQDFIKQVKVRKKVAALFQNYDELYKVIESIKDGSFDSIDDLAIDYEVTIKKLYSNLMESQRGIQVEAAASLDLVADDYEHVIDMIKSKYDRESKTPTGFEFLDKILYGGYEPSRLYVWGGGSGSGKSTILSNFILRSAMTDPVATLNLKETPKVGEIKRVYVYVTMENFIDETFMRIYQPLFDKRTNQALTDITSLGVENIKKMIQKQLIRCNSTVMMKYFPAMSISSIDLMGVVDEAIEKYGKNTIAGLYVDYLDLLKTDIKYDMYRLELGHIALALKTLAVEYNIPVITASQLSRKVYQIQDSQELSLDQMSESIKKVEHADFVGLIAKDKVDEKLVHGKIGKNRAGQSNINLEFSVDFSRYKFLDVGRKINAKKKDASSKDTNPLSFTGLGSEF